MLKIKRIVKKRTHITEMCSSREFARMWHDVPEPTVVQMNSLNNMFRDGLVPGAGKLGRKWFVHLPAFYDATVKGYKYVR